MGCVPLILEVCEKESLASNTPLISVDEIQSNIWLHLPRYWNRYLSVLELYDVDTRKYIEIDDNNFVRDNINPWISVDTSILDMVCGHHAYRLTVQNTTSNEQMYLYFSYCIQDDDPEKPYYYMGKYRKEE